MLRVTMSIYKTKNNDDLENVGEEDEGKNSLEGNFTLM